MLIDPQLARTLRASIDLAWIDASPMDLLFDLSSPTQHELITPRNGWVEIMRQNGQEKILIIWVQSASVII